MKQKHQLHNIDGATRGKDDKLQINTKMKDSHTTVLSQVVTV